MKAASLLALPILSLVIMAISQIGQAQDSAFSPAPPPTSDGTAIDQAIAYLLMLVALGITYMFH